MTKPREHSDLVELEPLARAPAIALLSAAKVGVDRPTIEREPSGQTREDADECRAVGFARGCEAERHSDEAYGRNAARMTAMGAAIPVQTWNEAAPCRTKTS